MSVSCIENWWEISVAIKYVSQLQRELVGDGDRDQICLSNVQKNWWEMGCGSSMSVNCKKSWWEIGMRIFLEQIQTSSHQESS